jgi:hypothetical protein
VAAPFDEKKKKAARSRLSRSFWAFLATTIPFAPIVPAICFPSAFPIVNPTCSLAYSYTSTLLFRKRPLHLWVFPISGEKVSWNQIDIA